MCRFTTEPNFSESAQAFLHFEHPTAVRRQFLTALTVQLLHRLFVVVDARVEQLAATILKPADLPIKCRSQYVNYIHNCYSHELYDGKICYSLLIWLRFSLPSLYWYTNHHRRRKYQLTCNLRLQNYSLQNTYLTNISNGTDPITASFDCDTTQTKHANVFVSHNISAGDPNNKTKPSQQLHGGGR